MTDTKRKNSEIFDEVQKMFAEQGGAGMWKDRADHMLSLLKELSYNFQGNPHEMTKLRFLIDYVDPEKHPEIDEKLRQRLQSYLTPLPEFSFDKGYEQKQRTLESHGYLTMQVCKAISHVAPETLDDY